MQIVKISEFVWVQLCSMISIIILHSTQMMKQHCHHLVLLLRECKWSEIGISRSGFVHRQDGMSDVGIIFVLNCINCAQYCN